MNHAFGVEVGQGRAFLDVYHGGRVIHSNAQERPLPLTRLVSTSRKACFSMVFRRLFGPLVLYLSFCTNCRMVRLALVVCCRCVRWCRMLNTRLVTLLAGPMTNVDRVHGAVALHSCGAKHHKYDSNVASSRSHLQLYKQASLHVSIRKAK